MSLRDLLRGRSAPEPEAVALPFDGNAYASAERALEVEQRTLQALQIAGVEDLAEQVARVTAAEVALAALPTFTVLLRQLDAETYDELVEQHPPSDEQRKRGLPWAKGPFRAALLAACVVTAAGEPSLTEQDWAELARERRVAAGELELLFAVAVNMHLRQPQVSTGKRLETDGQLALEMAACVAHGISRSHFLGGPPVWTRTDRDLAVWYEIHKREACGTCGTRPDEWDPAKGGHLAAYIAQAEPCYGCDAIAKRQESIPEKERASTHVHLHRNPEAR